MARYEDALDSFFGASRPSIPMPDVQPGECSGGAGERVEDFASDVRSHHRTIWWIAIVDDGSQKARVVEYEHILYYP